MRLRLIVTIFLLFNSGTRALAFQNISGIWEGTYDSAKHLKVKADTTTASNMSGREELATALVNKFSLIGEMAVQASPNHVRYPFKTKIYYSDNQLHLIDLTNARINMLHFVGLPEIFATIGNSGSIPAFQHLTVPLNGTGKTVKVDKSSSGSVQFGEDRYNYNITLNTTFSLDGNTFMTNRLLLHIDCDLEMEKIDPESENKKDRVAFAVDMGLERNTDHTPWQEEEVDALLKGLVAHPFYEANFGKLDSLAHQRLPEVIWGKRKEAYEYLIGYAFAKYRLTPPIKAYFYPDFLKGDAQYDRIANMAPGEYFIKIGPKAFQHPLLYTVSAYVHEYTHYKQYWLTWTKFQRETEAYCVQMQWLEDNYDTNRDLNYIPLNDLKQEAEGGFAADSALSGKTLVCNDSLGLARWAEISAELRGRGGRANFIRSALEENKAAGSIDKERSDGQWETIIDF